MPIYDLLAEVDHGGRPGQPRGETVTGHAPKDGQASNEANRGARADADDHGPTPPSQRHSPTRGQFHFGPSPPPPTPNSQAPRTTRTTDSQFHFLTGPAGREHGPSPERGWSLARTRMVPRPNRARRGQ